MLLAEVKQLVVVVVVMLVAVNLLQVGFIVELQLLVEALTLA